MSEDELQRELVRLRRGRAVTDPQLEERLGPLLRELSGVLPGDHDWVLRQKVRDALTEMARHLPHDLRHAAELALALGDEPAPQLTKRIDMLAEEIHSGERTARRRMDQAARLMARAALAWPDPAAETDTGSGWRVRSFAAVLRLDTPTPELYETRTVVAGRPLDEILIQLDLPPLTGGDRRALPLSVDVVFGARLTRVEHTDDGRHYDLTVSLPRTLAPADQAEFCLHYRVPPGQPIRDHYAIVPLDPCDHGRVRVRFAADRLPDAVWRLSAVTPRQMDRVTTTEGPDLLKPDGAGEVTLVFGNLRQGHGYGVAWRPAG